MKKLTVILAMLFLATSAFAQGFNEKETIIGFKGGLITSGSIYIEEYDWDMESDMSYSAGAFLDYKLAPKLFGGLAFDIHNMSAEGESARLMNFSMALKALIFSENSNMTFRPGFSLGYGIIGDIDEAGAESSKYFTVGGFCEFVFSTQNESSYFAEIGIIAAPAGGNDDLTITFGPMFLIRGGMAF